MDSQLKPAPSESRDVVRGGMPFERPADMPVQDLKTAPPAQSIGATPMRVVFARLFAALGTLGLAGYGVFEMLGIVSFSSMTVLQGVMIVFFAITLLWISFAAASAVTGLLIPPLRSPGKEPIAGSRTALVMPIYNEDPARTTAALQAMAEALAQIDAARHFEIVIISDSTNADAWIGESLAVDRLRRDLRETMPVWYRRRWHNTGRKAGNVEEFVKRWGGRYDYMIVLDADSLMAPKTLVALVSRMQADRAARHPADRADADRPLEPVRAHAAVRGPRVRQPDRARRRRVERQRRQLSGATTRSSASRPSHRPAACRSCRAASRSAATCCRTTSSRRRSCAAPAGRCAWRRTSAARGKRARPRWSTSRSATAAGRRATCSTPRSSARTGSPLTSRAHLAIGIMGYLSSPLWLMLMLVGFALTLQATLIRPEYFSRSFQLFPDWPRFDAQRMMALFIFTMVVLFTPKILGMLRTMFSSRTQRLRRRHCGITVGAVVETSCRRCTHRS